MSTASNRSYRPNRHLGSSRMPARPRAASRAQHVSVSKEEAFSYALRVAFLHHLLQPRQKRKQYVAAPPKPTPRAHTGVGHLVAEFGMGGNTGSLKLPHKFPVYLTNRMQSILQGRERLPGFDDAAVKRSFAEAYLVLTDKSFAESMKSERKIEPMVLMFYSSAVKASQKVAPPGDENWKLLPDRHLALFVRLVVHILREQGADRDKPDLVQKLATLETKLLTNDQNLTIGKDAGTTIEVEIPFSYDIKDMPMVQTVLKVFGYSPWQAQTDINENKSVWTEEAVLRDLKTYQQRLSTNQTGALREQDFELKEAYTEWRKSEASHLSQMILSILTSNPRLRASTTSDLDRALPNLPQQQDDDDDQAYADLARLISSPVDTPAFGFDNALGMSSLATDDSMSIRSVDEANYTFIPHDSRAFYKAVVHHAMAADAETQEGDRDNDDFDFVPLFKDTHELLLELATYWRLPQSTRLIAHIEVSLRKYTNGDIALTDFDQVFEDTTTGPPPEVKKAPPVTNYAASLFDMDASRWTMADLEAYLQAMKSLHEAVLRDVYNIAVQCYDPNPPTLGVPMHMLREHLWSDPYFTRPEDEETEFSLMLASGLKKKAREMYRTYLDKELPPDSVDWHFGHIVKLGQAVIKTASRIKKRYSNKPETMGVNMMAILVETVFPSFESDTEAIIKQIVDVAQKNGEEVPVDEGFALYSELVEIRQLHVSFYPSKPFGFDVEELLASFVWRWIDHAESKIEELVENAIKQDKFEVRGDAEDGPPPDSQRHSVSIIDVFRLFRETTDQVFNLGWDNDVHHARFMTVMARSFALGIGRYCEMVWEQFTKEMDRPTAQEAAAAQMTAQEKFLQMAKGAWNSKERVEPFKFPEQSFVKLNNIEYAMQQLDQLEKSMNVDACAELLQRVDGPRKQSRKPDKFVFTVKIIEAEDLKACDTTGFSDPYVVLCDEYQKRLAKTRIIYRNLNPRWDESVDITVQGPINLIATIWDYDTFGDHDFVGRTSLKLDPRNFSDYTPRECWLDLDTQGRLLLRITMEGERDDIQFHFGKAFRHLKRTERDMVRKITDKLTMHINNTLSTDTLRTLLGRGIGASMASVTSLWKKRTSEAPAVPGLSPNEVAGALENLAQYFDDNFGIMKKTLTDATMTAVMTRLWKEVLMAIENLLVPPLSDKPSTQKPLNQREVDVVFQWLQILFDFFNARNETGEAEGISTEVLRSPKYHELASLNFFYFEDTANLINESERMARATAQRQQALLQGGGVGGGGGGGGGFGSGSSSAHQHQNRLAPPPPASLGAHGASFGSLGTIRRGKSIMMSRNLGTMRKVKEERRKEAQADPSDDMILRILRMRPEAAGYLLDRHRSKERQAAKALATVILNNSQNQGFSSGMPAFGRNNLPRR